MKQTKLVVHVESPVGEVPFVIDPATFDNVRSCIDIWHAPGTKITLDFVEFEVDSNISNN